jgi:hypothetical protein
MSRREATWIGHVFFTRVGVLDNLGGDGAFSELGSLVIKCSSS